MAKDFSAKQIRVSQLIASGAISGTHASIAIYSASDASNLQGGYSKTSMFKFLRFPFLKTFILILVTLGLTIRRLWIKNNSECSEYWNSLKFIKKVIILFIYKIILM